jgi:hypothetical protein
MALRRGLRVLTATSTLWRLGPRNLLRVALYRAQLRSGWWARKMPIRPPLHGPFFAFGDHVADAPHAPLGTKGAHWRASAQRVLAGEIPIFSHRWVPMGFPPAWNRSALTGVELPTGPATHWSHLPDFGLAGGDVKGYWETARFDGLLTLALGWLCGGGPAAAQGIERWMESWCEHNPTHAGVQWKCGQEASIRLMQGLLAAELLCRHGKVQAQAVWFEWVAQHAERIAPTMHYAAGQDNNHGTSEAAALFIAGLVLARAPAADLQLQGANWHRLGRRWMEDRLAHLVQSDGSFSQHSTNYHRLFLDTCSLLETFRCWYDAPPLSDRALSRCQAATRWLQALTDYSSGGAPNLGANDGARLFVMHGLPYRDFRPSVQWAATLFLNESPWPTEPLLEPLRWLSLEPRAARPDALPSAATTPSQTFAEGGYLVQRAGSTWLLLRLPRFRFRPSHADALHLDLWVAGCNLLCDAGSFSYNTTPQFERYFSGTESHNTVQFDGRDQMPRLSRFLFGQWLRWEEFNAGSQGASCAYRDAQGARHRRSVRLGDSSCTIIDEVAGFRQRAVLRWHLPCPAEACRLSGLELTGPNLRIRLTSTLMPRRVEIVPSQHSLHYSDMTPSTALELEVNVAAIVTTEITWAP